MTLEEARKVGEIVAQADGCCDYCAGRLVDLLNESFLAYVWEVNPDFYACPDEERVTVRAR